MQWEPRSGKTNFSIPYPRRGRGFGDSVSREIYPLKPKYLTDSVHDDKRGRPRGVDRTRLPRAISSKVLRSTPDLASSVCSLSSQWGGNPRARSGPVHIPGCKCTLAADMALSGGGTTCYDWCSSRGTDLVPWPSLLCRAPGFQGHCLFHGLRSMCDDLRQSTRGSLALEFGPYSMLLKL